MSTALTIVQPGETSVGLFADNPAERRRMFLNLFQRDISEDQLALLFGICDRYGFDPMLKHVVLISKAMYVTRDGMRQYAHRTGLWDGIEELDKGQDKDGKWRVTVAVYRKGCARPFVTTAYQVEHENPKSAPWQNSPYRMTFKCAELAALQMAFPVELGGAEEIGFDGVSRQTNIGTVIAAEAIEGQVVAAAAPAPAPIKVQDWDDAKLIAELGYQLPEAQERRIVEIYLGRGTDRTSLAARLEAVKAAGVPKQLANEIALACATALGIPPRPQAEAPPPPDAPLTEVVGEPEARFPKHVANLWAVARQAGWSEERVLNVAKGFNYGGSFERWSADQLDSFTTFIRQSAPDQAAV